MQNSKCDKKVWIDSAILFVDVVGFSQLSELKQEETYKFLWNNVKKELRDYQEHKDFILKSTGDGILLIAFNPKLNLLEVAKHLQSKLRKKSIYLRQGLNCGQVLPLDKRQDAIGESINMAQRIMDCGDKNHILASNHYVAVKVGKRPPCENYHDLGEFTVKHKEKVHIFNYYDGQHGNRNSPHNLTLLLPELKSFCIFGYWGELLKCCELIDLSHDIRNEPPCTFPLHGNLGNINPEIIKGQSVGYTFYTTKLDNFCMNYGTHIDFPGHLGINNVHEKKKVGDYPLNDFVAEAVVVDVRDKLVEINKFIDEQGYINYSRLGRKGKATINKFLKIIKSMEITFKEFQKRTKQYQSFEGKAILFCTGLDSYWRFESIDSWRYRYFFNPYISAELASFLIKQKVLLVGIDALQVENPLINFSNKEELPIWSGYERIIKKRLEDISGNFIHRILLNEKILIVENLKSLTLMLGRKSLFIAVPLKLKCSYCKDNSVTRAFGLVFKK